MIYAHRYPQKKGEKNKTESAYALKLEAMKQAGEIVDYTFEPETLKLGPDCRYTPDFRVLKYQDTTEGKQINLEPLIEFHEVKGTKRNKNGSSRPYCEDDALVKIKAASVLHPYKFIIVWLDRGVWQQKEIN